MRQIGHIHTHTLTHTHKEVSFPRLSIKIRLISGPSPHSGRMMRKEKKRIKKERERHRRARDGRVEPNGADHVLSFLSFFSFDTLFFLSLSLSFSVAARDSVGVEILIVLMTSDPSRALVQVPSWNTRSTPPLQRATTTATTATATTSKKMAARWQQEIERRSGRRSDLMD